MCFIYDQQWTASLHRLQDKKRECSPIRRPKMIFYILRMAGLEAGVEHSRFKEQRLRAVCYMQAAAEV